MKRGRVCCNEMALLVDRSPDTVLGPDISVYTDNKNYDKFERNYPKTLPALIVDVLSPNDRLGRMIKRIERLLAKGVELAWLIDPESRNVTIFRPGQAPFVLEEGQEIANLPELPGFRCRVAELFEVNED